MTALKRDAGLKNLWRWKYERNVIAGDIEK